MKQGTASTNAQMFSSKLAALIESISSLRSGNSENLWIDQSAAEPSVGRFLSEFDFNQKELSAVQHVLEGNAVELVSDGTLVNSLHRCLMGSCFYLGSLKIPTHVIALDDTRAEVNFRLFAPIANNLGIDVALIKADTTSEDRKSAYQCDLVFLSARERALDYLRDSHVSDHRNVQAEVKYEFLKRLNISLKIDKSATANNALTFALIDDIDLVLSEAAMTPVHLYEDPQANNRDMPSEQGENIVAASNFFRVFSTYGKLGGFGVELDQTTKTCFAHYPLTQVRLDGIEASVQSMTKPQARSVRSQLHVLSASYSAHAQIAKLVRTILSENPMTRVILERVPHKELEALAGALAESKIEAAVGGPYLFHNPESNESLPSCLLLPFSLSQLPSVVAGKPIVQSERIDIVSVSFEESFRAERRKRARVEGFVSEPRFHTVVLDSLSELGISSTFRWWLDRLPGSIRTLFLTTLIRHKQKESDRHRSRTLQSLIQYEQELDDLLAFSG